MDHKEADRKLGMHCEITRRDFLNGVAVGVGGAILSAGIGSKTLLAAAALDEIDIEKKPGYYPPSLTGIRGNHDGSFVSPHRVRDGATVTSFGKTNKTNETYDLVVVGAGISGLAAAHFFRKKAGANAKILILDNHDDFGGHAKRNEFNVDGRLLLANGGAQSLESPGKYSSVCRGLIDELGIKIEKFEKACDGTLYSKMGTAAFFDKETFGKDALVTGMNKTPWKEFLAKAPLTDSVKDEIARVYTEMKDYLPGLSVEQKLEKLRKTSYADYLTKHCNLSNAALPFFQSFPHDLHCVGIEATPAFDCYDHGDDYESFTYPGFQALGLPNTDREEPYIYHFPDGNSSVARLLVRSMIPEAVPGSTMEDVVCAKANYAKLDVKNSNVRLRLNSTVVNVEPSQDAVQLKYMRQNKLHSVEAKNCVLACYNTMIPYICPTLPQKQKDALSYLVKCPLIYSRIALRNWSAFAELGTHQIVSPGSYHTHTALDFPVSIGKYEFAKTPKDPALLFMLRVPCQPGLPPREQFRCGRAELLQTDFAMFERNIRDQLGRMLKGTGFNAAKDIAAITVNRWAHGYAYAPNSLFDPDWKEEEKPWVIGRKPFGRITIANSDSGAKAYLDAAVDQAHRAVQELKFS